MHCYAFNLQLGSSIIQNLPICPSADSQTLSWGNTGALLCVEAGVKQENLHEIIILRLPDLFLGLKMYPGSIHYLLFADRWSIQCRCLCSGTLETACPSFPGKYFDVFPFLPLVRIQYLWRCSRVTFHIKITETMSSVCRKVLISVFLM